MNASSLDSYFGRLISYFRGRNLENEGHRRIDDVTREESNEYLPCSLVICF